MVNETKLFPNARFVPEGSFLASNGAVVLTSLIDLGGLLRAQDVRLAKLSRPEHGLETASSVRLSRPDVFRENGEVLLQDAQEGRVARTSNRTINSSDKEQSDALRRRLDALNVAAKLNKTVMNLSGSTKDTQSHSSEASITFGSDWLIYCTAICCSENVEDDWKGAFPESYTCSTTIYRPTQFAQALGLSVCEHVGAFGKPSPVRQTLSNFLSAETKRIGLFAVHGPTLYVDNPYDYVSEAKAGWEMICAMIFLKSREHAREKEYRFAILPAPPTTESVVYLPVSGAMRDCLSPPASPGLARPTAEPVIVPEEGATEITTSPSTQKHTYRRRLTRTKKISSGVGKDEIGNREQEEDVIEETIVSPDEVREPFPNEEDERPDVIIFHQYGSRVRYVHEAFRDVETERLRVETTRRIDLQGGVDVTDDGWPGELSVPPEVALEAPEVLPWNPELILEFCLNPSRPRMSGEYAGDWGCTTEELEHVLNCGRSLKLAVELVPELERERAAASSWYAFGFIAGLVVEFGMIVKSVCIVRESVAVVELVRASFSGAVGWATFSGSGTYTLYICKGNTEEFTLPGRFSWAHPIGPGVYADALHQNGWHRKK